MKRTSYFLLVLTLLLTFAGCNQKEKKLQQIDLTHEQSSFVRDIMASALDLDGFLHSTAGYHHDTLVFGIVVDTLSEKEVEKMTKGEQLLKNYLLTALCCDSSPVKELFSQIAAVSAPIKLFYGDSSEEEIIMALNGTELREALAKEYKQRDVLGNYFEWLSFYESDEEYNVSSRFEIINETDYIVVVYASDSMFSDINERVNFDIDNAKDNFLFDIDDIVDLNEYKDKISKKYRDDYAEFVKEYFMEEGLFDNMYIPKLMQKTNVGLIIRYEDKSSNKTMDIVFESNELLGETHDKE